MTKIHFIACVRLSNGSERRWITKKEKENTVARRPKLCTMAQKFPHLHVQKKKNSWSLEAALHSGLWKRWREQHGEGGRVIIIPVFTRGTCSCKVQRRRSVIWPSRCSISRASTVPFPSSCLKGNINNVPPHPPKPHRRCYAHWAKTNCCNTRPKIIHLVHHTSV